MPWPLILADAVSPVGTATSDIVTYILGYGVLGVGAVLYTLRIIVPGRNVTDATARGDAALAQARADHAAEVDRIRAEHAREVERLLADRDKSDGQRDAAMRIATEQIVPLASSFVATSQSLIPLLQEQVRKREG